MMAVSVPERSMPLTPFRMCSSLPLGRSTVYVTFSKVSVAPPSRCEACRSDSASASDKAGSGFRRQNGEALFGQNLIHEHQGRIRVGDSLKILEN